MAIETTTAAQPAAIDLLSGKVYADACTHCGLCLESCPTYTLWGREPDSPRGRIVQIEDAIAGGGSVSEEMATHIDSCLGCMACVTVCPEDVQYDQLLTRARVAVRQQRDAPLGSRLRDRVRLEARTRSGRVRTISRTQSIPSFTPANGNSRGRVGLLLGCTQRAAYSAIHAATVGVLAAEGYEVIAPELPECCGALELSIGAHDHGASRAQATIDAFAAIGGVDHVVVNTGRCGAAMKGYGRLLGTAQARAFSGLVVDVHELLARNPAQATLATSPGVVLRVLYHDACQLRHGQGVDTAPQSLLARIPGLELIELRGDDGGCCGAPGMYASTQPQASAELGRRQAQAVIDSGAQVVVSGDHACIGQLSAHLKALGHPLPVHHPVELLWAALRAADQ